MYNAREKNFCKKGTFQNEEKNNAHDFYFNPLDIYIFPLAPLVYVKKLAVRNLLRVPLAILFRPMVEQRNAH